MSVSEREVEELTALVQRYCAVENDGDEVPEGYFAIKQGSAARKARQARAPVKWGEVGRCTSEVLRRVRDLASNGEGHVFVAAHEAGSSSPLEQVRVEGGSSELADEEGPEPDGSAVALLVHGLMRSNALLVSENREWRTRAFNGLDRALDEREHQTGLTYMLALAQESAGDARMQAALQALGPTIEAVAPKVVDALARYMGAGAAPATALPEEPGPRLVELVRRMVEDAKAIAVVVTAAPAEATPDRVSPLYELVRQLAGPLGLKVTGFPAEQPAGAT